MNLKQLQERKKQLLKAKKDKTEEKKLKEQIQELEEESDNTMKGTAKKLIKKGWDSLLKQ